MAHAHTHHHHPHRQNETLLKRAFFVIAGFTVVEVEIDPRTGRMRGAPRVVSPDMGRDVDNYDACYLPNDDIVFCSTAGNRS